ncbi:MAG: ATP-binding protein, partial [Sutterellaceae bacterium]|nr:ATP-binding protein [Sutterellaceae bacterium]
MTDNLLRGEERWHITRLQVFNWGTFSNIHDIPISDKGFLFVGASGSGKSTLLDAMITLLFPNPSYNAAAREGDRRKGDRSLLSYIRGAWATQADLEGSGSPKAKTQYLRPGATFTAIALTFNNQAGVATTLMLVASIRKSSNEEESVNRQYFVIDGNYSFNTEDFTGFARNGFDWRWLKGRLPTFSSFNRFNAYCEAFCDRFGIQSTAPLKLLAKAQSAKNLGDLNVFMRSFMLDEPRTLGMAERLTTEFKDLKEAHAAVVDTRNQLEVLSVAKSHWEKLEEAMRRQAELEAEKATVPWWFNRKEVELQQADRVTQQRRLETAVKSVEMSEIKVQDQQSLVDDLRLRRKESGGQAIERLQDTVDRLNKSLAKIEKHADLANKQAETAGRSLPKTSQAWLEFRESMADLIDEQRQKDEELRTSRDNFITGKAENEKTFRELCTEIESMRAHPNNIPAKNLALRADLADALGVAESDLPFVGELIEVKKEEQ